MWQANSKARYQGEERVSWMSHMPLLWESNLEFVFEDVFFLSLSLLKINFGFISIRKMQTYLMGIVLNLWITLSCKIILKIFF